MGHPTLPPVCLLTVTSAGAGPDGHSMSTAFLPIPAESEKREGLKLVWRAHKPPPGRFLPSSEGKPGNEPFSREPEGPVWLKGLRGKCPCGKANQPPQ